MRETLTRVIVLGYRLGTQQPWKVTSLRWWKWPSFAGRSVEVSPSMPLRSMYWRYLSFVDEYNCSIEELIFLWIDWYGERVKNWGMWSAGFSKNCWGTDRGASLGRWNLARMCQLECSIDWYNIEFYTNLRSVKREFIRGPVSEEWVTKVVVSLESRGGLRALFINQGSSFPLPAGLFFLG